MAFYLDPQLVEWGLVSVGGDLRPDRLLDGYRRGIFPWFDEGGPICWWSPDPRAIFDLGNFYVSRRLARTIRSDRFATTINQAFSDVMHGCADRPEGTWLTTDMIEAYQRLHELGWAHSIEVWHEGCLAGGIYGVAIDGFFAGESMFHRVRDASKVALAVLVDHLRERGYRLFDTQMLTGHTERLGAVEIPREEYLERLRGALGCNCTFVDAGRAEKVAGRPFDGL
jgi:leucyl/phenylalanyl-tRNA---protein transferase